MANSIDIADALSSLERAVGDESVCETAAEHIRQWLHKPWYQEFREELVGQIQAGQWPELNELFWMQIPFGTAGRRGKMAPIGCNAINRRTVAETVQALAVYVAQLPREGHPSCAIAYDTRHRSPEFARLSAEIMVAAGFKVFFFDGFRATPLLSTTIRRKGCDCGVMISASHNPPADNAIKVFWKGGAQLRPPHDQAILQQMGEVTEIDRYDFDQAVERGMIVYCQGEMEEAYIDAVLGVGVDMRTPSEAKARLQICYSPLHGVGLTSVLPTLRRAGFSCTSEFAPHASPDGDFPNVPGNVANPENPNVFTAITDAAGPEIDLILASDPDADRIGAVVRRHIASPDWMTLTGNQIGALLGDYLLKRWRDAGKLTPASFVVKTLVTSDLLSRIAELYGAVAYGDVLTGFKWISKVVDEKGADDFVLGTEEAHGYLAGTYARDKDAAIAALLLAEFAAAEKQAGRTLFEALQALFVKHGFHYERTIATLMPGADGMQRMRQIMERFRCQPPATIGGLGVAAVRDYQEGTLRRGGRIEPLDGPTSDLIFFDLDRPGYRVGIRPSGTEPKIKFYLFAVEPTDQATLAEAERSAVASLDKLAADLQQLIA